MKSRHFETLHDNLQTYGNLTVKLYKFENVFYLFQGSKNIFLVMAVPVPAPAAVNSGL